MLTRTMPTVASPAPLPHPGRGTNPLPGGGLPGLGRRAPLHEPLSEKPEPRAQTAEMVEVSDREAFGVFYGLRAALLIYAGTGIACAVGYEIWSMLAH